MKVINKFFIFAMSLALSVALVAFCLDSSLLSAKFLTAQADQSGIYTELAKELPAQIAKGQPNAAALETALGRVITPVYLKSQFDSYLVNLESAYRNGTVVPPLDLSPVLAQAQGLGLTISQAQSQQLAKQLQITTGGQATDSTKSSTFAQLYRHAASDKWLLLLASLALAALVFVTAPHQRLHAVAKGLFGASFWLLLYSGLLKLLPGLATHQLSVSIAPPLTSSINHLIQGSATGVAKRVLYAAAGTAIVGVGAWLIGFIPAVGHSGSQDRTPLPNLFHKD